MNNDFVSIRGLTMPRRMILQGAASLLGCVHRNACLLRCMSPFMAPRVVSLRCQSSDAIGGEADMPRPPAPYRSDATCPKRTFDSTK